MATKYGKMEDDCNIPVIVKSYDTNERKELRLTEVEAFGLKEMTLFDSCAISHVMSSKLCERL